MKRHHSKANGKCEYRFKKSQLNWFKEKCSFKTGTNNGNSQELSIFPVVLKAIFFILVMYLEYKMGLSNLC